MHGREHGWTLKGSLAQRQRASRQLPTSDVNVCLSMPQFDCAPQPHSRGLLPAPAPRSPGPASAAGVGFHAPASSLAAWLAVFSSVSFMANVLQLFPLVGKSVFIHLGSPLVSIPQRCRLLASAFAVFSCNVLAALVMSLLVTATQCIPWIKRRGKG